MSFWRALAWLAAGAGNVGSWIYLSVDLAVLQASGADLYLCPDLPDIR